MGNCGLGFCAQDQKVAGSIPLAGRAVVLQLSKALNPKDWSQKNG